MRGTVSIHGLVVAACWAIGAALAVLDAISGRTFGAVSHLFIGAGATLYIAGRLERLADDWLLAYRAGREVTRLRSHKSG